MWYTPGRKAKAEFKRFNTKEGKEFSIPERIKPHIMTVEVLPPPQASERSKSAKSKLSNKQRELFSALAEQGITEPKAFSLVTQHEEATERELEAIAHRDKKKIQNLAGFLISAIESGDYTAPAPVEKKRKANVIAEQKKQEQAELENLKVAYSKFLKGELESLKKNHKAEYEEFSTDFGHFWEIIGKNLQEDKRAMVELGHLERYAEQRADFPILTFAEWRANQK